MNSSHENPNDPAEERKAESVQEGVIEIGQRMTARELFSAPPTVPPSFPVFKAISGAILDADGKEVESGNEDTYILLGESDSKNGFTITKATEVNWEREEEKKWRVLPAEQLLLAPGSTVEVVAIVPSDAH